MHLGIARLGVHHAYAGLEAGKLVAVSARFWVRDSAATVALVYPRRTGLAPRVRVLVDHLMAAFAADPALNLRL
jgi:DNA-binding transcriptional LysR family regulator